MVVNLLMVSSWWRESAACLGEDPELFFPHEKSEQQAREAKAVCASCEVKDACLATALRFGSLFGVWGGMTEVERDAVKRRQRRRQCNSV